MHQWHMGLQDLKEYCVTFGICDRCGHERAIVGQVVIWSISGFIEKTLNVCGDYMCAVVTGRCTPKELRGLFGDPPCSNSPERMACGKMRDAMVCM